MRTQKQISFIGTGCSVLTTLMLACSSDSTGDGDTASGGSGGRGASGSATTTGGASATGGSSSSSPGGASGGTRIQAGAPGDAGGDSGLGGTESGGALSGGQDSGGAGQGGADAVGCGTVRSELLGPIDTVSVGLVEDISEAAETTVTLRIDASAGGYMAATMNPYIYVKLADGTRVELTDLAADTSTEWDLALKRDNLRMNGGDSGSGSGAVAVLDGVEFDAVTADSATGADFGVDDFVNNATCELVVDAVGKPLTRFDGWYDYGGAAMTLAPAAKVFLIRSAQGVQLYKLQILGYYQELSDGAGGTVKKSAVYTLRYAAL